VDYEAIFSDFIENFVQPDSEWLVFDSGQRCTYWQYRMAQNYEIRESVDGQIHLISAIALVIGVTDSEKALKLCNDLNAYTGNFSFAYNEELDSVFSLCSVTADPGDNVTLRRFALATIDQAWLSDQLSSSIAEEVGGQVNWWSPREDGVLREWPDVNFHQQTAVRSRPEWVSEILPWEFPTGLELGRFFEIELWDGRNFAGLAMEKFELEQADETVFLLRGKKTGDYLRALWIEDLLYGTSFTSELRIVSNGDVDLQSANDFIWAMIGSPTGQLLSGIYSFKGGICFRSILPSWQLRKMSEDLSSGSRSAKFLLDHFDVYNNMYNHSIRARRYEWQERSGSDFDSSDMALPIVNALSTFGQAILDNPNYGQGQSPVDRRFLWIAEEARVLSYGFFNPMGPTFGLLFTSPAHGGSKRALVHVMRHTVSPVFEVLGHYSDRVEFFDLLEKTSREFLSSPPTWMTFFNPGPEEDVAEMRRVIVEGLTERWSENSESIDLLEKANRIKTFGVTPWQYASHEPEKQTVIQHFGPEIDPMLAYLAAAEDPEVLNAMLSTLPYAWDGAINFLESNGALHHEVMDVGPYPITFSKLGSA
jgi:hypothetical protein